METDPLAKIAAQLAAPGKGILAADESLPTIEKRFKGIGIASTEETRRAYREMLFTTEDLGEFISGVILFDETLRQKTRNGAPLLEALLQQGILPGIKVDKGTQPLPNFPGEKITEGLDGLATRLKEYRTLGARFTKWRAVLIVGPSLPGRVCIEENARLLARFAALSQEAGLVPIVEPEVLMDGNHTLQRHFEATEETLQSVFEKLHDYRVAREGMLLKPNMVLSGKDCPQQASAPEVAEATLRCLKRTVPAAVPGIMFLSGGQSDIAATRHLNAMNQMGSAPWQLSFSYGRALQASALKTWAGKSENTLAAQKALSHRARCNSAARSGRYNDAMETIASAA